MTKEKALEKILKLMLIWNLNSQDIVDYAIKELENQELKIKSKDEI